jgi:uncharacterized membrane protein YoaT (DUF817 family)
MKRIVSEFLVFCAKQAWACLFGILMLMLLYTTHVLWPANAPLARYDFMVLASLAIQIGLLALRLERWDEAIVILVFHITGTVMEIYKIAHGSWLYPEPGILRIMGVPLFSGFMYASVGSYIARATRLFGIRYASYPPLWTTWLLALLAYINFFSHHYTIDIRLGLFAFSALIFWRTQMAFTVDRQERQAPLLAVFIFVALLIWAAENIATFAVAWIYPSQADGWHMVRIEKMGAWYLLMLLSFVLVSIVHRPDGALHVPPREGRVSARSGAQR